MNNIKAIFEMIGIKNKDVANHLGITMQNLNIIFRSATPKKYTEQIAAYLKIDSYFLTKEVLSEEDKNEIIKQHYNILTTRNSESLTTYKTDLILSNKEEFTDWLSNYVSIDFEWISIDIKIFGMDIPTKKFEWAEIQIKDSKINIKSNKDYEVYSIDLKLIQKVIIRNKDNITMVILELNNSITFIMSLFMEESNG